MSNVFYIPNGPKDLRAIFTDIDFSKVDEYYIEVLDLAEEVVATTTINKMGCCCNEDMVRIRFLNYLGTYDGINFSRPVVSHKPESNQYINGLTAVLNKTDTGIERANVRANDTKLCVNNCYNQEDVKWLQELCDSPKAFEEWTGTEQQADSFLPIRILDRAFDKAKNVDDYLVAFELEYVMANGSFIIRN